MGDATGGSSPAMTPPSRKRLRIGLLGASAIAPYALLDPSSRRSDVAVVAVAARDPLRAQRFAARDGRPIATRHRQWMHFVD